MNASVSVIDRPSQVKQLLAVPEQFIETARQFPEQVDQALALLDNAADVSELLARADTLEHYAKRIKTDTVTVNCIQYGKLKIVAKLGELIPRDGKRGRGKKSPAPAPGLFSSHTVSAYRKVADNSNKLDEYNHAATQCDEPSEMSTAGFIRFVASDGNLKAHQNKGVIEWYTPQQYVEAARSVMGSIDLDPASNGKAQQVVKAGTFYTREDDGLTKHWTGNVFLNPPFRADLIKPFVAKLCQSFRAGDVPQAILLTNNSTDTLWWHEAAAVCSLILFTLGRIAFYSPADETASSPTSGHTFFYLGERQTAFCSEFSQFGLLARPTENAGRHEA